MPAPAPAPTQPWQLSQAHEAPQLASAQVAPAQVAAAQVAPAQLPPSMQLQHEWAAAPAPAPAIGGLAMADGSTLKLACATVKQSLKEQNIELESLNPQQLRDMVHKELSKKLTAVEDRHKSLSSKHADLSARHESLDKRVGATEFKTAKFESETGKLSKSVAALLGEQKDFAARLAKLEGQPRVLNETAAIEQEHAAKTRYL